ncbi:GIY-YIG nuclease family protein [Polaromonas sp.]|uniref:GIY-YIG nuclease family protein n=1 Tax=Polaromonas sp. TaxID=1869339 RepID=UPI00352A2B97
MPPVLDTEMPAPAPYSLYLLLCKGGVIYAGITNDVPRRYQQHCDGKGARFTRSRPPQKLLCHSAVGDRSAALKLEYQVKQLPRAKKVAFVQSLSKT